MRYAYAITGALLLGGTAIAVTTSSNVGAQTAQNEGLTAAAPQGAPASLADMVEMEVAQTQKLDLPGGNADAFELVDNSRSI